MEDGPSTVGRQGQAVNRHDSALVKSQYAERPIGVMAVHDIHEILAVHY